MSLFRPNLDCVVVQSSGKDVYGQPKPATRFKERCAVVRLQTTSLKSSVRADSSASRGSAQELVADTLLLLSKNTHARIDDVIEVAGKKLRVIGIHPRYDLLGALDHHEVEAMTWRIQ